jgi:hypothetical protein
MSRTPTPPSAGLRRVRIERQPVQLHRARLHVVHGLIEYAGEK